MSSVCCVLRNCRTQGGANYPSPAWSGSGPQRTSRARNFAAHIPRHFHSYVSPSPTPSPTTSIHAAPPCAPSTPRPGASRLLPAPPPPPSPPPAQHARHRATTDAFVAQAARFDGSKPAPGTTNTQAWIPVDAPSAATPPTATPPPTTRSSTSSLSVTTPVTPRVAATPTATSSCGTPRAAWAPKSPTGSMATATPPAWQGPRAQRQCHRRLAPPARRPSRLAQGGPRGGPAPRQPGPPRHRRLEEPRRHRPRRHGSPR